MRDPGPEPTAIVTGAYGAIGKAICRGLAGRGFTVQMVGRDARSLDLARGELQREGGPRRLETAVVDLSRESAVLHFARAWKDRPLHVLVNNAGATPKKREETPEGIERQFATNVLGYYWMLVHLTPALRLGAPSRVVNVASYWAGDLDLEDLEFRKRRYDNDLAYRQSKQANRMMTVALAERLGESGITVNACHPGDVRSKLASALGYGGSQSPDEGADTPVWLATEPAGVENTGRYFARRAPRRCEFADDRVAIERLMQACAARSSTAP